VLNKSKKRVPKSVKSNAKAAWGQLLSQCSQVILWWFMLVICLFMIVWCFILVICLFLPKDDKFKAFNLVGCCTTGFHVCHSEFCFYNSRLLASHWVCMLWKSHLPWFYRQSSCSTMFRELIMRKFVIVCDGITLRVS
jgi:hypothetical protein